MFHKSPSAPSSFPTSIIIPNIIPNPSRARAADQAMEQQFPLSHEASAGDTNKQTTPTLPPEVVQCLENARFLHLATCTDNIPHVSLMSYTYLASSPFSAAPVVVMTTNPASKKTNNLVANPNVSLLVHDWVSHRPPNPHRRPSGGGSPGPEHHPSSLAALLLNLNTSSISSISATINGAARLAEAGSDEEAYYRRRHLENNSFDADDGVAAAAGAGEEARLGDAVRLVVVSIRDVRISDWKGSVRDWVIVPEEQALVNGVR